MDSSFQNLLSNLQTSPDTANTSKFRKFPVNRSKLGQHPHEFDLVVLGGGSGGLAAAREAAKHGAKVALLDYVIPSTHNTRWGLGGTCVNVGCIPKKLFHHAALYKESFHDAEFFGWSPIHSTHSWEDLVRAVEDVRKGSNFSYRVVLGEAKIEYINAYGRIQDPHTIQLCDLEKDPNCNNTDSISSAYILLAPGTRPKQLDIPGGQLAISSDDLFQLPKSPGRTVIIGGGYIALETAGILACLGCAVIVLVRTVPLREFDREYVAKLVQSLQEKGVTVYENAVPTRISDIADQDCPSNSESASPDTKTVHFDQKGDAHTVPCQTVISCIGRTSYVQNMQLDSVGISADDDGKITVLPESLEDMFTENHDTKVAPMQTAVSNIHAVGDVVTGKPELTPLAIKDGERVARYILGKLNDLSEENERVLKHETNEENERSKFLYEPGFPRDLVPTTIFTPVEYSCVGMSEERARALHGDDNIEVYHTNLTPTEWSPVLDKPKNSCSAKIVVLARAVNSQPAGAILGMHYFGPNAGEVMQGYAAMLRLRPTFNDLKRTIGIHPTTAEEFVYLNVSKSSGLSPDKQTCCG